MSNYRVLDDDELLFLIDFLPEWENDLIYALIERYPEIGPADGPDATVESWEESGWETKIMNMIEDAHDAISALPVEEKARLVRDYFPGCDLECARINKPIYSDVVDYINEI